MNIQGPSGLAVDQARAGQRSLLEGYLSGFGNGFETEALPGALAARTQLAAEVPLRPLCRAALRLALHGAAGDERAVLALPHPARPCSTGASSGRPISGCGAPRPAPEVEVPIAPMRWDPDAIPNDKLSFLEGMRTITTAGDAGTQAGMGAHVYLVTRSMQDEYFYNADGEMLFVPQQGELRIWTEFGIIDIEPGEIAVIPRGVKLRVELRDGPARGYLCENYGGALTLPDRGPIGANCLANPRDFLTPVAAYEDKDTPSKMYREVGRHALGDGHRALAARRSRLARQLRALQVRPTPLLSGWSDPVRPCRPVDLHRADLAVRDARHGQHRLRDLLRSLDGGGEHLPSALVPHERHERVHGAGLWPVRCQDGSGFVPGGVSLHNTMLPHGPDVEAFENASNAELKPHKLEGTMAFMFETRFPQRVTAYAAGIESCRRAMAPTAGN